MHTDTDVPTSTRRKSSYNFNNKKKSISINKNNNDNTINDSNTKTTSFIENNNKNLTHNRNYSDADANDSPFNRNIANYMSLKTRRFFRARNKDNTLSTTSPYSDNETKKKFAKISFNDQQSFFHKVFNNIFRRRSNLDHLNSVENLFTRPSMN